MAFEHRLTIAAPASAVWALTLDVVELPSITPTIEEGDLVDPAPLAVGSRVRLRQPGDKPRIWTVDEIEPGRRFAWSTGALGTTMQAVHEVTPLDAGSCTNTLRIELSGATAPLLRRLMAAKIRDNLAQENAGFARSAAG